MPWERVRRGRPPGGPQIRHRAGQRRACIPGINKDEREQHRAEATGVPTERPDHSTRCHRERHRRDRRSYLPSNIGAVALKQDGHVTAIAAVQERKDVTGPFRRKKRLSVPSRALSGPSCARARVTRADPHSAQLLSTPNAPVYAQVRTGRGPEAGRQGACVRPCGSAESRSSSASPSVALGRALWGTTPPSPPPIPGPPRARRGARRWPPRDRGGFAHQETARRPVWEPMGNRGESPTRSVEAKQPGAPQPHLRHAPNGHSDL